MKLRTLILIIFLILIIPNSFAAIGFDFKANYEIHSIDLEYGSSKNIPISITNTNTLTHSVCNLECYYTINNKDKKYFNPISTSNIKIENYRIYAPDNGKDETPEQLQISTQCDLSSACLSSGFYTSNPMSKSKLLTVTYKLTYQQREARDYVDANLPQISTSLTNADVNVKKVKDKLNQLTNNIKVGDIPTQIFILNDKYNTYKAEADKVRTLNLNFDYIQARSNLRSSLNQDIINVNQEAINLESKLTEIINQHNKVVSRLDDLSQTLNLIMVSLNTLNKEESKVVKDIKILIKNFEDGNFESYSSMNLIIDQLKELSINEKNTLDTEVNVVGDNAIEIYGIEIDLLCKNNFCLDKISFNKGQVKTVCSNLKKIKEEVVKGNLKRRNDYDALINKYQIVNNQIEPLNEILDKINLNVKKGMEDTIEDCKQQISKIRIKLNDKNIQDINPQFFEAERLCQYSLDIINQNLDIKNNFFEQLVDFFKYLFTAQPKIVILQSLSAKEPNILANSNEFNHFLESKCNIKDISLESIKVSNVEVVEREIQGESIGSLEEAKTQCCVFDECTSCCAGNECKTDSTTYPIIFVHGHSAVSWNNFDYSIGAFQEFQNKLNLEKKYVSAGIILPETNINQVKAGDWGKTRKPISVRVSYYNGVYDETGKTIGKEQNQPIDIYSQRLADIVEKVLHHTNKDKVILVAHSMGGLVSRGYIKNYGGSNKVHKLVTIGTPNHGIFGWFVGGLCGLTHLGLQECEDMQWDNQFIKNLNSGNEAIVPTLSIIGKCGEKTDQSLGMTYGHDEVIRAYSAEINGAKNVIVEGECYNNPLPIAGTFHQDLVSENKVYEEMLNFIK